MDRGERGRGDEAKPAGRGPIVVTVEGVLGPRSITLAEADLEWTAVRASGPGGQNVNKVSSKVELRFDLVRSTALPADAKERLRAIPGVRLDADGRVVVVSQLTRDQVRNLEDARDKLRDLVARALPRPKKRRPTRPTRASNARRLEAKGRASQKKRDRRAPGD